MRRLGVNHIYALYKGEQNLADGTLAEISRKTGKTYNTLKWMTYPSYKKTPAGAEP